MTQANRLWTIGAITVMVVLIIAGWFLGAQPFIDAASRADAERSAIETQNATSQIAIAQLAEANANLPALEREYATLQESIPSTSDTAPFINGLDGLAQSAGVQVTGFTVGDPIPYTVPASAASPVVSAEEGTTETTTEEAPVVTAPVGPTAPAAVTSPLITPDNFIGIQVSITVLGPYSSVLGFIDGLQTTDRLFLVTGINSAKEADSGAENTVTATVTGMIYVIKSTTP